MTFSMNEVAVIFAGLNTTSDGKMRQFETIKLPDVVATMNKMKPCITDGKIENKDYEIDFATVEKTLILSCLDDHTWGAGDAEFVMSVKEKLK